MRLSFKWNKPLWLNWNLWARLTKSMSVKTDELCILAGNRKGRIFIMLPSFMRFLAIICMMALADHAAINSSSEATEENAEAAETPKVSGKKPRGKTGSRGAKRTLSSMIYL